MEQKVGEPIRRRQVLPNQAVHPGMTSKEEGDSMKKVWKDTIQT
jgi:hypothetical protein